MKNAGIPITPQLIHRAREKFNNKKRAVGSAYEADMLINVKGLKPGLQKSFQEDKIIFTPYVSLFFSNMYLSDESKSIQ
jgi:hypothetical protein